MYEKMKEKIVIFEKQITNEKLRKMFHNCFYNTLDTTIEFLDNDEVYLVTGDIPAMWLRDSSASVIQYLDFVNIDEDIFKLIKGLIKRQFFYINVDPYTNAFNKEPNGAGHKDDHGLRTPFTWERKFEIDSLCYPIWLIYSVYNSTKDITLLDDLFVRTCKTIMNVFKKEQNHHELSDYYHYRDGEKEGFNIPNHGKGGEIKQTGMIWSGYRPSDDACKYGFFIPGNMFAVVILGYMSELLKEINQNELSDEALKLRKEVDDGIKKYSIFNHYKYGKIYAYETDGLGNYLLMDDANVPSLLSIPYFKYADIEDEIYQNTRRYCLSFDNDYYYEGEVIKGIGSPHTPSGYVWHIGVALQALTTNDEQERKELIYMILNSDADTLFTHEGVYKDDDKIFTRSWFAWSNSLFAYLILDSKNIVCGGN